eukprot:scaffold208776_cov41-Prasinocladus_malaysianus.AAC.1
MSGCNAGNDGLVAVVALDDALLNVVEVVDEHGKDPPCLEIPLQDMPLVLDLRHHQDGRGV